MLLDLCSVFPTLRSPWPSWQSVHVSSTDILLLLFCFSLFYAFFFLHPLVLTAEVIIFRLCFNRMSLNVMQLGLFSFKNRISDIWLIKISVSMSINLEYVTFIAIVATLSSLRAYSDRLCGNHTSAAKMSQEQICNYEVNSLEPHDDSKYSDESIYIYM